MKINLRQLIVTAACAAVLTACAGNAHAQQLINGGFEAPDIGSTANVSMENPNNVPGWDTTDTAIEIWANGFNGVVSYEGTQHAEINAFIAGTLYQDVAGIPLGSLVGFEFAHRGRLGTDTMNLTITDLGADNAPGGGNDTVLFSSNFSAPNTGWVFNTGSVSTPTLGNTTRFAYSAVSSAGGNPSAGNFLDAARFGVGVGPAAPEPATFALLGIAGLGLVGLTRRRS